MSFTSNLGSLPVIDDSNFRKFVSEADLDPIHKGRGRQPRDFSREPFGALSYAQRLSLPPIPRSRWTDEIQRQDQEKTSLFHLLRYLKITVKNQQSTNYCWINAPIYCLEAIRAVQNQPRIVLSPASCGSIIKNFQNVGGWGTEGVKFLVDKGAVPVSLWPANAIDRKYNTTESNTERAKYRVSEWWDIPPRSFEAIATCVLNRIPVAIGLNWWRHEVTAVGLVVISRDQYGLLIANSWGETWGDDGFGVLSESKGTPDDAIGPRFVVAA